MKLGQIRWNNRVTAAVFDGGGARPLPDYTVFDLICRSEHEDVPLTELVSRLVTAHVESAKPLLPVRPREVWACGCTYETSAAFRDGEIGAREGFYAHVYKSDRPEIFFKGTARVCVGPDQPIGIRPDSKFTAPEPELAAILGSRGRILGFTLANDVSAWDIERENPLYLPQSKIYTGSCSLGPVIVTPDELGDPRALEMTCTIHRNGARIFSGSTSTSRLSRKVETLVDYLLRANAAPAGTVLLTGTGIIVDESNALAAGDVVSISIPQIGELSNPAAIVRAKTEAPTAV
jgi:2-dehydro-3-deoxy-D-arabinonate dehydratase